MKAVRAFELCMIVLERFETNSAHIIGVGSGTHSERRRSQQSFQLSFSFRVEMDGDYDERGNLHPSENCDHTNEALHRGHVLTSEMSKKSEKHDA